MRGEKKMIDERTRFIAMLNRAGIMYEILDDGGIEVILPCDRGATYYFDEVGRLMEVC